MSIDKNAKEIIEDFELFDDWADKYEYIISLGKELAPMPEELKTEDRLVKGCQSRVWMEAKKEGDQIVFLADSDAVISKGIIALLVKILSGHSPQEIANHPFDFVDKIGLKEHLSPNRSNGLVGMMKQIKTYAIGLQ